MLLQALLYLLLDFALGPNTPSCLVQGQMPVTQGNMGRWVQEPCTLLGTSSQDLLPVDL